METNKKVDKEINNLAIWLWIKGIFTYKDIKDLLPSIKK